MPNPKPLVRRFGQVDFDSMIPLLGAAANDADIFVTRRGAFGANRTLTRAQIISGAGGVPDPLLLNDGNAAAPSYSFINDPDTGFFKRIDSELNVSVDGVEVASFRANGFNVPDGTSAKAGLGFLSNDSTGFHLAAGSKINVALSGTTTWQFSAQSFGGTLASRPELRSQVPSATLPTVVPNKDDADTGIGWIQSDNLALITGAINALGFLELSDGVVQSPAADVAITALAGGGQGGAGALKQSYNVISVAATAGDSVTLPNAFFANSLCFIKNNGANSVDVFPASGDDLGQGANVAEPLAAGASIAYIATVLNATWTPLIVALTSDPLLLNDGSAAAPTYSFISDPDTGIFLTAPNQLAITVGGTQVFKFQSNALLGTVGNSGGVINEPASTINPTLCPNKSDFGSGIGSAGLDQISLIAGDIEIVNLSTTRAAIKMGSGVGQAPLIGVADVNTTAVGNVGAGVDDLITFSLPANSLSVNGKAMRITAWGSFAANGNTKQVNLDFGATTIRNIGPGAINGLDWRIDAIIIRTGAATQKAIGTQQLDATAPDSTLTTPAETLSGAVIIKCTGEGTADNDIVQEGMLIEHLS